MNEDEMSTAQSTALSPALRAQVEDDWNKRFIDHIFEGDVANANYTAMEFWLQGPSEAATEFKPEWSHKLAIELDGTVTGDPQAFLEAALAQPITRDVGPMVAIARLAMRANQPRGLSASEAPGAAAVTHNPPEVS